jgi:hypothetical protein
MKGLTITIFLAFFLVSSYAQKQFGIKIYQNTDFFKTEDHEYRTGKVSESRNVNFDRLSVALDITTERRLTHELEILIPEVTRSAENIQYPSNYEFRSDVTLKNRVSSYSLRYEVYKTFGRKDGKFAFFPGVGINPYYLKLESIANATTSYTRTVEQYGVTLNVTPRITWTLSKRFVLDLNVPLRIYDLRASKANIKNPMIPIRHQTNKGSTNIFLENVYTIRLGVMYNLTNPFRQ